MNPAWAHTGEAGSTKEPRGPAPVAWVAKDGGVWRWECRVCGCSDVRWRHRDALREVRQHLARHNDFGFGRKQ